MKTITYDAAVIEWVRDHLTFSLELPTTPKSIFPILDRCITLLAQPISQQDGGEAV